MVMAFIIAHDSGRYMVRKVDEDHPNDDLDLSFAEMLEAISGCHPIRYRDTIQHATPTSSGEP